jgi:ATP-dependent DNA helicase RecG
MTRLLQGDVGSGKTVVALYASLVAIANGSQAAIMAPTEILAQQHFNKIEKYLAGSRVKFALLRGKQTKKHRAEVLASIESGETSLVVGTQALIQQDIAFADLAMVTVDEQHKFGVLQRAAFRTKGPMPHYLVMTATPIPRTLSMTVFGDLDVSVIKHGPPGRGKVITRITPAGKWSAVAKYVRERLERGEQAFVVCPVIGKDESDEATERRSDEGRGNEPRHTKPSRDRKGAVVQSKRGPAAKLASAKETYEKLTAGPWRGLSVALLHGSMRPADKQAVMDDFVSGKTHALVATTVVEVGVDVANATIMVVEHAERYGLSQLHQLRGRIGRGGKDGLCVLIVHTRTGKALERLDVMANTTDGFKIAEADLSQRGPGELLGTRQHGLPELRVGDIISDFALLDQARADAFEIVAKDPQLRAPQHARMIPALKRMFGDKLALIDAA